MLSRQVIDNDTSNLVKYYMSICSVFGGGKQFNRIQSGAFEGQRYAAGLRVQVGPTWQLRALEHATGVPSGLLLESAMKVTQLEKDRDRKTIDQYDSNVSHLSMLKHHLCSMTMAQIPSSQMLL